MASERRIFQLSRLALAAHAPLARKFTSFSPLGSVDDVAFLCWTSMVLGVFFR